MKRKIVYGICLIGMIAACKDEKEERAVKFPVNVKAVVTIYDQFGVYKADGLSGASVAMKAGTTPVAEAQTDADGLCNLQAITGTYHFECSKSGYAPAVTQAYQFLGGDTAYPVYMYLREVSTTRFEDVALSIDYGQITVSATVYHSYPYLQGGYYSAVQGVVFMSTSPDVSSSNYMQSSSFFVQTASGKTAMTTFNLSSSYFPSGATVYAKIYGVANNDYGTFDIRTNRILYTTLGPASVTAEITVP